jgi:hypothetical protein
LSDGLFVICVKNVISSAGLPNGVFSHQKAQLGLHILEGLGINNVEYFMAIRKVGIF